MMPLVSVAVVARSIVLVAVATAAGCAADFDADIAAAELSVVGTAEEPREPGDCSVVYRDEVVVDADLTRVWDAMIDLPRYVEWNPWIVYADGEAVPGAEVPVGVVLNGHVLDMKYVIQVVEPEQRFCTRDAAWFSTFIYGQRCRMFEVVADGRVRVWQELLVDGPFSHFADLTFGRTTREGMAAELAALAEYVQD